MDKRIEEIRKKIRLYGGIEYGINYCIYPDSPRDANADFEHILSAYDEQAALIEELRKTSLNAIGRTQKQAARIKELEEENNLLINGPYDL